MGRAGKSNGKKLNNNKKKKKILRGKRFDSMAIHFRTEDDAHVIKDSET